MLMSPNIANWVKTFSLPTEELRLEFFDRLENLCEYDYKMSDELRGALRNWFPTESLWLQFVHLIEQYSDLTIPRVTGEMESIFRKIIPEPYYLAWRRIFDTLCPVWPEEGDYVFTFEGIDPGDTILGRFTVNGTFYTDYDDTTPATFESPDILSVINTLMLQSGFTPGYSIDLVVGADYVIFTISNCVDDVAAVIVATDAPTPPSVFQGSYLATQTTCTGGFCQTINDVNDLPVDDSGCSSGIVAFVDLTAGSVLSTPYVWNGSSWDQMIEFQELPNPKSNVRAILLDGWEVCFNWQGWTGNDHDPNSTPSPWKYWTPAEILAGINLQTIQQGNNWDYYLAFRNSATGCVYQMPNLVDGNAELDVPVGGTCEQTSGPIDLGSPSAIFINATINGDPAANEIFVAPTATIAYILSTYGFTPQSVQITFSSDGVANDTITIDLVRLTSDPEVINFGVFSNPDATPDPIVDEVMLSISNVCNPLP